MSIPFTQYVLPNGRKEPTSIETSKEVDKIAHDLIDAGCRFDIEILRTGQVSMTCEREPENEEDDGILSMEICENGPKIINAVTKLVNNASKSLND